MRWIETVRAILADKGQGWLGDQLSCGTHDSKISREELVARLKQVNKELGCARRAPRRAGARGPPLALLARF